MSLRIPLLNGSQGTSKPENDLSGTQKSAVEDQLARLVIRVSDIPHVKPEDIPEEYRCRPRETDPEADRQLLALAQAAQKDVGKTPLERAAEVALRSFTRPQGAFRLTIGPPFGPRVPCRLACSDPRGL